MVPGEGPQPCLAMIVGEAPGAQEVAEGRPFAGRSGKLLEVALRSFGIAREDVYITNVVKEWPCTAEGATRKPYQEEVDAWLSVLHGEIENTTPRAILTLGKTATLALLGLDIPAGSKVDNIYTAWHPSYLLHGGGDRSDWLEQIKPWVEAWRG